MASPFDRLMNTVRPRLPGALDDAIRLELFNVCLEFFRLSGAWRDVVVIEVPARSQQVEIFLSAGRVERLFGVFEVEPDESMGRAIRGATLTEDNALRLPFAPTADGFYGVQVALTVTDPLTRDAYPIVPASIIQRYHEALVDGVLSMMMSQPSKPYSNTQMAMYHKRRFSGGASRARNALHTGNTLGSQNWSFPQSFNRRK